METTIYIVIVDGQPHKQAYKALRTLCQETGISYRSASKGRRKFIHNNQFIEVQILELIKGAKRGKYL